MNLEITEKAANRIRRYLEQRGSGAALRIGIKRTGCSGYSYTVDYADEPGANDQVLVDRGVRIVVDREHAGVLDGIVVDFVREGLNEKFVFVNPNAGESCGCGESFSLKTLSG